MAKKADDKKKLVEQVVSAIEKTDKGEAVKEASKQFNKLMAAGGELNDEFFENQRNAHSFTRIINELASNA